MNISTADHETDLDEEIVAAVCREMGRSAEYAYDQDGDLAGITYYDGATAKWYAASVDDLRKYVEVFQRREDAHYSVWCAETSPEGEADSRAETLALMGWVA